MAKKKAKATSAPKKKATGKKTPPKKTTAKGKAPAGGIDFESTAAELEDAWERNREEDQTVGGSFEPPEIPDGDYVVQLISGRMAPYKRGDRKGTFYVRFQYNVVLGEYAGTVLTSRDDLSTETMGDSGRTRVQMFMGRLQRMGLNTAKIGVRQVPDLIQWLTDPSKNADAKPYFQVGVRNNEVPQDDGSIRRFQNVYVNELLDREEVEAEIEG